MQLLKKKTRKAVVKQTRKLVKRYGPEAAIGIVTGLVGAIVAKTAGKKASAKKAGAKKQTDGVAVGSETAAEQRAESSIAEPKQATTAPKSPSAKKKSTANSAARPKAQSKAKPKAKAKSSEPGPAGS